MAGVKQYDRTDLEEFDNANLIDNDIDPFVVGFLEAEIEYGSQVEDDVRITYLDVSQNPAAPLQIANLELGYLTPPVGMNLFLASYRFEKPLLSIARSTLPLLLILGVGVILITYVPWLTTVLLP